jgi:hypothetical protein
MSCLWGGRKGGRREPPSVILARTKVRSFGHSLHCDWTTYSHAGSSRSGTSELKSQPLPAPWQSMTTISVAPAAFAPRTALISSV